MPLAASCWNPVGGSQGFSPGSTARTQLVLTHQGTTHKIVLTKPGRTGMGLSVAYAGFPQPGSSGNVLAFLTDESYCPVALPWLHLRVE